MFSWKRNVNLALGGGGARGLAHIGVIRAMEQLKIVPNSIAGTSMGAIVGALCALGMDSEAIEGRFRDFLEHDAFTKSGLSRLRRWESSSALTMIGQRLKHRLMLNISLSRKSVFDPERLKRAIDQLIPESSFEDTVIPFIAVATDVSTGERVECSTGPLREAVLASSSIPGFFPPVNHYERPLLDGGVTDIVPVDTALRMWGKPVIAVEVSQDIVPAANSENLFETLQRTSKITSDTLTRLQLTRAQFVLAPKVDDVMWYEFERLTEIISAGEADALKELQRWRHGFLGRIFHK